MGSFDYTCCISGLPIGTQDEIRYLLLVENLKGHACTISDHWKLHAFPIKARYDGYGRAKSLPEGPLLDTWLECLKRNLIERGPGDNSCHDVPVRKDMSLAQIQEAIWEGRVMTSPNELPHQKVPKGIPTIKRVRRLIEKAGAPLSDGDGLSGFMVSKQANHRILVRWGAFKAHKSNLLRIQPHLEKHYATMLTAGTGNYPDEAELIVATKPGTRLFTGIKAKPARVVQAMIREDVWQALLRIPCESYSDIPKTAEEYRNAIRSNWDDRNETSATPSDWQKYNEIALGIFYDAHFSTHFELMRKSNPTKEELATFLDTVGETLFIQILLSQARYIWRPSYSAGPQEGAWRLHARLLQELTGVVETEIQRLTQEGYYEPTQASQAAST